MRKLFWIFWSLLLLAFAGSHFRSAAVEYQLTRTIWLQAATGGGGVRLVVLCGDPSATRMSGTVIGRDKDTWRYGLGIGSFGYAVYHATADLEGTPVDTYRFDFPLLPVLLTLLGLAIAVWALKRWGAPAGLIWEECRRKRKGNRLVGVLRTGLLCFLSVLTAITAFLWIAGHVGLPPAWSYLGENFAFATAKPYIGYTFQFPGDSGLTAMQKIDQIVSEHEARLERPQHHVSVEVMAGQFAFRYFKADAPARSTSARTQFGFGGFEFLEEGIAAPTVEMLIPPRWFASRGVTLGLERTVMIPAWALLVVLAVWPLWCFLRGPLQHARRRSMGCCIHCGYSLTGLIQPRCPECGKVVDLDGVIPAFRPEGATSHGQAFGE